MLLHSHDAYHVFISLQSNFEDVSLLCLGQEEEHGLGLMCSRTDKNHTPLWVIQVILLGNSGGHWWNYLTSTEVISFKCFHFTGASRGHSMQGSF